MQYGKVYLGNYAGRLRKLLGTDLKSNEISKRMHSILSEMGIKPDKNGMYDKNVIDGIMINKYGKFDIVREKWNRMMQNELTFSPGEYKENPYYNYRRSGESNASLECLRNQDMDDDDEVNETVKVTREDLLEMVTAVIENLKSILN